MTTTNILHITPPLGKATKNFFHFGLDIPTGSLMRAKKLHSYHRWCFDIGYGYGFSLLNEKLKMCIIINIIIKNKL
jgi:hypothetical protein